MFSKRTKPRQNLQKQILQSLGYDKAEQTPGLQRARRQLKFNQLSDQLSDIAERSQKRKIRVKQNLSNTNSKPYFQQSDEMKQLQWRLQVLREDRRQRQKKKDQPMTFDQMYKRQKNKYLKFRERQKIKVSDPKYLEMIGSTQMRREKRRIQSLDKIDKHIEALDQNIQNHVENSRNYRQIKKKRA